jgi:enterochelin esterase family protein
MNAVTPLAPGGQPAGALHPDLAALVAGGDLSGPALDGFLAGRAAPLSEPGALTFLWRGEAASVELLRWIHAGIDARPFARLPGSDLWHLRVPAEDGGRFEYKIKIVGAHGETWDLDPLNPHRAADPFGENSVAMSHGYARPDWSLPRGAPAGELRELPVESATFGHARDERVYLPAGYDLEAPYPLVIIHDGGDYDDYAELTTSLDNLIAAGDVPPLIALLIQAGDRMSEYPRGRRHARYVVQELLPALEARHAVSRRAEDRVLMGASLGAVASLATAFRFPGVFGGLILKSGSFILDPAKLRHRTHPVFGRVERLVRAIERAPDPPPTRVFVSTGELEGLAEENRALAEALEARGMDVRFQSAWDGHHWHAWRDQLRDALMWALPGDGDA